MIWLFLLLIIISLWQIKFNPKGFDDYLGREQTLAINGIFVALVFLKHSIKYVEASPMDSYFLWFNSKLGQMVVASFLFYSGYGIMVSLMKKEGYIKTIPKKRIFNVWHNYAYAVSLYLVVNLILGIQYPAEKIALSYIGWKGIGNSYWYIFAMIVMYIGVYISRRIFKNNHLLTAIGVLVFTTAYHIILKDGLDKIRLWYNTIYLFPLGMFAAINKGKLDKIKDNWVLHLLLTVVLTALFIRTYSSNELLFFEIRAVLFISIIVLITMKVKINNKILQFLGKYTFEIYILQKMPLMIYSRYISNENVVLVLSLITVILMAVAFRYLTQKSDALIGKAVLKLNS